MHKNEFELKRLAIQSGNVARGVGFGKHVVTMAAVVYSVKLLVGGVMHMVGHDASSLTALALVVEKLNIGSLLAYVVAAGTGTAWVLERRGKQRAYKELGDLRRELEKDDPYRGSSHLDDNGHAPS